MDSNKRKRDVTYGKQGPQQTRLDQLKNDMFNPDNDSAAQNTAPPLPPNKPRNQKEATMVTEPSDDAVDMVIAVAACSREHAIRYLKAKNNDIERAVTAILDNEDISKDEASRNWDDTMFSQDRDGNAAQDREGSLRPLGTSAAPTRGPSPAGSHRQPQNQQQEDADMAQALALSQQDAGGFQQQETGVVRHDGSTTSFGPATQKEYEASNWAMVPVSQASSEVVPDVDVEQRRNAPDEPRFLKQVPSGDYLPNFLTICHAIPAAKEALLLRDHLMGTYGSDAEWWRGHGIALPKIVHTGDGTAADPDIDRYDEFIAETQRLMAFLDESERSYASASALLNTEVLRNCDQARTIEAFTKSFIDAAEATCGKRGDMMQLFSTNIGTTAPDGVGMPFLEVVDLAVDVAEGSKLGLMESLDHLLWGSGADVASSERFIQQGADVLVTRARQKVASRGLLRVEVPSELYLDKYLEGNVEASKGMRLAIAEQKEKAAKLDDIGERLRHWKHPTKTSKVEAKSMLAHTVGRFSGKNMRDVDEADKQNDGAINGDSTPENPHYAEIARKLETISINVEAKLAKLTSERHKIQEEISRLSNASPPELIKEGLKERYHLMGVATKPSITYVLCQKPDEEDDELISLDDSNSGDQTPAGMQWWRIEYVSAHAAPRIDKTKVPDYDVLRAVELEHHSALLVYASERAIADLNVQKPLPEALQQFVKEDNRHFRTELQDATIARPPPAYEGADQPRQSIEHEMGPSRRDSISSTTVQADGDDLLGFNGAHPDFGLPPARMSTGDWLSQQQQRHDDDVPVTEIHLSSPVDDKEGSVEMAEKEGGKPLFSQGQASRDENGDREMEDVGVHVEDAGK